MEGIGKPQMNHRKYCPCHAATVTFMSGKVPEEADCVLILKPFKRDKIDCDRDHKNSDAQKKIPEIFIF
jgi:hypothetical protein